MDLSAEALSIVAEKMNVKWRVCVVNRDDFETSKTFLEHSRLANLQVTLHQYDSLKDICQHMMQAHLVLMLSRAEPFGLVGLEAIAAGSRTQQPAQVEKRKASTSESDEGAKAFKPEKPPLLPIKIEILKKVKPSVKTVKHLKDYAAATETLKSEITMTDETLAMLKQQLLPTKRIVVKTTINVEDFRKVMVYILTTSAAKGLDHTTSVGNITTTRHADHSSLRGLDLATCVREDKSHKGTIDSTLSFTAHQVQTALRQVRKSERQVSQVEHQQQLQTAREGSEALIRSLGKQVTMLTEEKEKAQKVLLEHKETIKQIQDTNTTKETRNEELTAENIKLSNQLKNNDNLQDEVRALREKNETLQKLLSEKTQETQQSQETSKDTGARPKSWFGRLRSSVKQTMEHQNQGDDSRRKEKQPEPEESSSKASKEEKTDLSSGKHLSQDYPINLKEQETAERHDMSTNILLVGCKGNGKIVDTPGVSQEMTESEFEELVQAVKMVPGGFDAICLVWDYTSSDKNEDKEARVFQSLHRLFGDELYKHLVILVTHAQQEDVQGFIYGLSEAMGKIVSDCSNHILAIENKPDGDSVNKEQVKLE
ncbi:GIMAP8 [Branchiostoma lanceolatum]|uniref:GIMAP8 protein n=1 Tax=Branchiostoma lanceolatum TaxID=7740 RepID=A0A8J9ZRW9_BRALA|nr:GIMAP8 [Branchiostoma lanceolatum]